ncbi:RNA-binding S4 domain-containing protein [Oenococcus sp. UCMA 17063]|nr:RNA-binding S4 domain-containing protein [Oenococcus sp. UCMA 17063]
MRLDKYLKISRLIKRRTLAKEFADQGRVTINGKISKSSANVGVGDILVLGFGGKIITIKVIDISEIVKKNDAGEMYELISSENRQQ